MPSFDDCTEDFKERLAAKIEVSLQKRAAKAVGQRRTIFPNKRTGDLIGGIRSRTTSKGVEVSFPAHAIYNEFGTGIYGPKHMKIKAKQGGVLSFGTNPETGKPFAFRSVKGMKPASFVRPYIEDGLEQDVKEAIEEAFKDLEM